MAAMGSAAKNTSTFDITMFDLQGAIELHCSMEENIDGDICLVHRLSPEVTYDDVDYVLNKSHYSGSVLISGFYVPCVLIAIGVISNVACLAALCCKLRNSPYGTFITYLIILNIIYLLAGSLTQALQAGGYTGSILSYHYLPCMLWPPLLELITHLTMWAVAVLALHTVTNHSNKHSDVHQFQARLKCLAVTVTVIFLNYHSTLLRELVLPSMRCSISPKSGSFYRYVWPWLKASVGIYIPWMVSVACIPVICCRKPNTAERSLKYCVLGIVTWYLTLCLTNRMILKPYEFSQMTTNQEFSDHVINLQLIRELCSTVLHSIACVPIAVFLAYYKPTPSLTSGKCHN